MHWCCKVCIILSIICTHFIRQHATIYVLHTIYNTTVEASTTLHTYAVCRLSMQTVLQMCYVNVKLKLLIELSIGRKTHLAQYNAEKYRQYSRERQTLRPKVGNMIDSTPVFLQRVTSQIISNNTWWMNCLVSHESLCWRKPMPPSANTKVSHLKEWTVCILWKRISSAYCLCTFPIEYCRFRTHYILRSIHSFFTILYTP